MEGVTEILAKKQKWNEKLPTDLGELESLLNTLTDSLSNKAILLIDEEGNREYTGILNKIKIVANNINIKYRLDTLQSELITVGREAIALSVEQIKEVEEPYLLEIEELQKNLYL